MNWIYKGEVFNPENVNSLHGFIYKITYELDNSEYTYYGKKNFNSITKKDLGKKELSLITDKRLKTYKTIKKESDWKKYSGSCKDIRLESMVMVEKEILKIIPQEDNCKTNLTYWETFFLMLNNVLMDDYSLNGNILGKFYKGRIK